ncbi:MAG: hypothetical protein Q4F80_04960, partial [bacterium]|nr:hypothetical protein [bacterium]
AAFYTTDGMRYEVRSGVSQYNSHPLHENNSIYLCTSNMIGTNPALQCGGCGSLGLNDNTDNTTKPPCLIMVDVNGDRKPNPQNINCKDISCAAPMKYADTDRKKLTDVFSLMITDKKVIPYGIAAQKAMYQARQ